MPTARRTSSSDVVASFRNANRMPSIRPSGIARLIYSGSRFASIWKTTPIGPPSFATTSNRRSILSRISSDAASASVPSIGISVSRKI